MSITDASAGGGLRQVWEPLEIGPTRVRNRIMMTAMGVFYGENNLLSDRHIAFYRERARGGLGLMITEQQAGHRFSKGSFHDGCTAWEKRVIPQYEKLADAVHAEGAKQFVQLFGCGVHDKGTTIFDEWHPLWGVSAIPSIVHREIPMVMDEAAIADVVKGFGESALNVKVAGLDGVELHAAHSYLLGQFLSPTYNDRTDRYGGSPVKRAQILIELGEEVRRRVGDDITVGVRISYDEFMGEAGTTPAQAEEQLEALSATGLFDYFNISGGAYHTLHMAVAPMQVEHGHMTGFAKRAKAVVGNRAKVFTVGRITDLHIAERVLREGCADMVAMTRAQFADPHLVRKTREGRETEIHYCIGANECISRIFDQRPAACIVNPVTGRERQWGPGTLVPVGPDDAKRIVVVGGGFGGMKTAAVAAEREHDVVLFEREEVLGGHINRLKALPTRAGWGVAIDNLARAMAVRGVDVRLGTEATVETIQAEAPDHVVIATGAHWTKDGRSPWRPGMAALPGTEADHVLDLGAATDRALAEPQALGARVVILDETGIYLPLGLAELLADAGVDVEVITPDAIAGGEIYKTGDLSHLMPRLIEAGVRTTTQHAARAIANGGVEVGFVWGGPTRTIEPVDTVVMSMMRAPDDRLFHALSGTDIACDRVGDALAPRKPIQVMYEAEELGRAL